MSTATSIAWVRQELEAHGSLEALKAPLPTTPSLCAFLKDGRALCLLTNALTQGERESESELPKKLQRSLNQLSTFHALERVQFFIKWCRGRALLDEHQIFTTVQLLDEVNEVAVNECIVALRKKYRPTAANKMSQFHFDDPAANDENRLSGHNIGPASSLAPSSSSGGSTANSSSRLTSFLSKFPTAPPKTTPATSAPAPTHPPKAPFPSVSVPQPTPYRSSSISSITSASSEQHHTPNQSFSEEIGDDAFEADRTSSGSAPVDRSSSVSESADRLSAASASASSPKGQQTSRLRIPSIFKNNRSSSRRRRLLRMQVNPLSARLRARFRSCRFPPRSPGAFRLRRTARVRRTHRKALRPRTHRQPLRKLLRTSCRRLQHSQTRARVLRRPLISRQRARGHRSLQLS